MHAADVTQSLGVMFLTESFTSQLTSLELLTMLLSALVHDVGHPGPSLTPHPPNVLGIPERMASNVTPLLHAMDPALACRCVPPQPLPPLPPPPPPLRPRGLFRRLNSIICPM